MWDRETGEPIHNAIVWQDTRTGALVRELAGDKGMDRLRDVTGLPLSTYFSGPKITWLLDNVDGARERAENGELLFGTTDTLGAVEPHRRQGRRHPRHRRHQRQPHAADGPRDARLARAEALDLMGVPRSMLPEIKSSSEDYGEAKGTALGGRPIAGHPRRPAGRAVRPDLLRARRRQEHLRHRLVPARQHRRGDRPHRRRCSPRVGYKLGDGNAELRARGLDRGHRRADPVAARPPGDHRRRGRGRGAGAARSTTTAASTSCRRSPACSRRTGATTPAASSSG